MLHYTNLLKLLLPYDKLNVTYKDLLSVYSISNISGIAGLKVKNVIRDLVFVFNILISVQYHIIGFLNLFIKILSSNNNNNIIPSANSKWCAHMLYSKYLE